MTILTTGTEFASDPRILPPSPFRSKIIAISLLYLRNEFFERKKERSPSSRDAWSAKKIVNHEKTNEYEFVNETNSLTNKVC